MLLANMLDCKFYRLQGHILRAAPQSVPCPYKVCSVPTKCAWYQKSVPGPHKVCLVLTKPGWHVVLRAHKAKSLLSSLTGHAYCLNSQWDSVKEDWYWRGKLFICLSSGAELLSFNPLKNSSWRSWVWRISMLLEKFWSVPPHSLEFCAAAFV